MTLDLTKMQEHELPEHPEAGLYARRILTKDNKLSWKLGKLVEEGGLEVAFEERYRLNQMSDVAQWRSVPIRGVQQGVERNAAVLEIAHTLLSSDEPMTLRHLFYMIVSSPNSPYRNCAADYNSLSKLINKAREDDVVEDNAIADGSRIVEKRYDYDSVAEFASSAPYHYSKNLWQSQDSYVECWFEKAAIMSVVMPLHREYQVVMRPFKGHASRTYCADIARDFAAIEKPITVYYCGDHDPSGYAIPRSGTARVREILRRDHEGVNEDFNFVRLGFNPLHFDEHDLPSWDVEEKRGDPNWRWFVENFGWLTDENGKVKCAEIDAIPPDELRKLIRTAIESHIEGGIGEDSAWDNLKQSEATDRDRIEKALCNL